MRKHNIIIDLRDIHQPARVPAGNLRKMLGHSGKPQKYPKCCMDGCTDIGNFHVFGPNGHNDYCLYHAQRADRYSNSLAAILDQKLAVWEW